MMSVSQLCRDNSVFFEFYPKFCLVKSQVSKEVILKGEVGYDGLYQFLNLLQLARQQIKSHFTINTVFLLAQNLCQVFLLQILFQIV